MTRMKTTLYIDEDLLRSARDLAERTDRAEQDIMEEALRRYLNLQMLEDTWANEDLPVEDEAMSMAYDELHTFRTEQQLDEQTG